MKQFFFFFYLIFILSCEKEPSNKISNKLYIDYFVDTTHYLIENNSEHIFEIRYSSFLSNQNDSEAYTELVSGLYNDEILLNNNFVYNAVNQFQIKFHLNQTQRLTQIDEIKYINSPFEPSGVFIIFMNSLEWDTINEKYKHTVDYDICNSLNDSISRERCINQSLNNHYFYTSINNHQDNSEFHITKKELIPIYNKNQSSDIKLINVYVEGTFKCNIASLIDTSAIKQIKGNFRLHFVDKI